MELTYIRNGDYLIPNLAPNPEPEEPLRKYGRMHWNYLEQNRPGIFNHLVLTGQLKAHCLEVQKEAEERMDTLMEQKAKAYGVDFKLKAADPMAWVRKMNNIKAQAEEIVTSELIYTLQPMN